MIHLRRVVPAMSLLVLVLILFAAAVLSGTAASAAPAPAAARLRVDAGALATFVPGRPLPVRVQVDSDVLVAGQVVVTTGSSRLSRPVEVPGGSSQRFEVVVPTAANQPQVTVQVSLVVGRTHLADTTVVVSALGDTEVVGILPQLLGSQPVPGAAPLSVDAGTARFVAVTDQDLQLAPASLGPVSVLALGADDLSRLSPDVRQAILTWTTAGGELLVDAAPADTVVGLPASWRPAGTDATRVGEGEVLFTRGAMAAGRWSGLVPPVSHGAGVRNAANFSSEPLSFALARSAGLGRPRLKWLIASILLYILVIGPVSFVVFRRRRRPELLWVVIPVVAVVFAAGSYAVGSAERSGLRIVHGSVVNTTSGGGTAVTYVGVSSPGETTSRLSAPAGWVVGRYDDLSGSLPAGSASFDATLVAAGVEGRVRLAAGQFAMFEASGPAHFPGQLVVDARADTDGQAHGIVTNGTPYGLHDVTVLIGGIGVDLGTVAAGGQATWQLAADTQPQGVTVEQRLWPADPGQQVFFGGPFPVGAVGGPGGTFTARTGGPANLAVWSAAPGGLAPGTRPGGVAVAVGWTDQYHPPVVVAGHGAPTTGDTAIVGTSPVIAGPAVGDLAVERRLVRGGLTPVGSGAWMNTTSQDPTVVAWTLPPGAAGHQLSLSIPAGLGPVTAWTGTAWQPIADTGSSGGPIGNISGGFITGQSGGGVFAKPVPAIPVPATPPPGFTFPPTTLAIGGPAISPAGGGTAVVLPAGPAATVYIRFGAVAQPVSLDGLQLKVLP